MSRHCHSAGRRDHAGAGSCHRGRVTMTAPSSLWARLFLAPSPGAPISSPALPLARGFFGERVPSSRKKRRLEPLPTCISPFLRDAGKLYASKNLAKRSSFDSERRREAEAI